MLKVALRKLTNKQDYQESTIFALDINNTDCITWTRQPESAHLGSYMSLRSRNSSAIDGRAHFPSGRLLSIWLAYLVMCLLSISKLIRVLCSP